MMKISDEQLHSLKKAYVFMHDVNIYLDEFDESEESMRSDVLSQSKNVEKIIQEVILGVTEGER